MKSQPPSFATQALYYQTLNIEIDVTNPLYVLEIGIHDHHNHLKWAYKNPTLFNTEIPLNILNII